MFNMERAAELFQILLNSANLRQVIDAIQHESKSALESSGWHGISIRQLLIALFVIFGAGTRGHVATRMTVEEFLAAEVNENGRVVFVEDHKTS